MPSKITRSSSAIRAMQRTIDDLKRKLSARRSGLDVIGELAKQTFEDMPLDIELPAIEDFGSGREEVAVLHYSDSQIGKTTPSYDSAIAEERAMTFVAKSCKITRMRRSVAAIKTAYLFLGGDIVEGETIFAHQPHEIDSDLFRQACETAPRIIVQMVLGLLECFDRVNVVAVRGNHGRAGRFGGPNSPNTNWDNVCYVVSRERLLSNKTVAKRVSFDIASDSWYKVVDVMGWGCMLVHGDQIRGQLGMPWYGFAKKVAGWADSLPQKFDYVFTGHFHTPAMITLGTKVVYANGTTESDNEFALESLAASGKPCQRLLFFNKKHGAISDNLIYLDKRSPAG